MIIKVRAKPKSKEVKVIKVKEDEFIVYLKSPPTKGKANEELIEVLSKYFGIPKRNVKIIKGEKSREKVIKIDVLQ